MLKILGTDAATLVTVPAPAAAQDPSPRQKVDAEALVPELRLATGKLPVTPVVNGSPVRLVATPEAGVPNAGVVSVGEVRVLLVRVCVAAIDTISKPPAVLLSCTTKVSLVVLTVTSPSDPVKVACCPVVPRLSCNIVGIDMS
jgi:hypothetical protein